MPSLSATKLTVEVKTNKRPEQRNILHLLVFPSCKINLGLLITEKRPDGFHNLETIFYPVPLYDALESISHSEDSATSLIISGLEVPGNPADNLVIKAYQLLKKDFPEIPASALYLHKMIPMGAGLGGGSADAAFALRLFNEQFRLNLSQVELISYALELGSDCPFFILDRPCFAKGRGEQLEPVDLTLKGYQLYIVNPGVHIATGWAFAQLSPAKRDIDLRSISALSPENWADILTNDFEAAVLGKHPELISIKEKMYHAGALYASMSGSGSSFFGIFPADANPEIEWPAHYFKRLLICEH